MPESLKGVSKGQNRITEYRRMLQAWHNARVITYAGDILSFPAATAASITRDIGIIQRKWTIYIYSFLDLDPDSRARMIIRTFISRGFGWTRTQIGLMQSTRQPLIRE